MPLEATTLKNFVFQYKNLKEELDEARKLECFSPK